MSGVRNHVRVFLLMAGLAALLGGIGQAIGGTAGLWIALALAGAGNLALYFWSSRIVLRMYGARVVGAAEAPALHRTVDRLRRRAGLPMPAVAIAPHAQPNAFATGRSPAHGVVCVTDGLLALLDQEELEAVIAHELAHIRNRDMLLQTITATVAGAITQVAHLAMFPGLLSRGDDEDAPHPAAGLLTFVVAPLAATLIQLAISRQREFEADRVGAQICDRPLALARALRRLEAGARAIPMEVAPAAAPLAQVSPFAGAGGTLARLFSTHPSTEERVARLAAMAPGAPSPLLGHAA